MRDLFEGTNPSRAQRLRYRLGIHEKLPPRLVARFFVTEALRRGNEAQINELEGAHLQPALRFTNAIDEEGGCKAEHEAYRQRCAAGLCRAYLESGL